jgi:hypothetical protein
MSAQATSSNAPQAPKLWPVMDFVELADKLYACSLKAFFIASDSALSF